jgi:hypothetical protein
MTWVEGERSGWMKVEKRRRGRKRRRKMRDTRELKRGKFQQGTGHEAD